MDTVSLVVWWKNSQQVFTSSIPSKALKSSSYGLNYSLALFKYLKGLRSPPKRTTKYSLRNYPQRWGYTHFLFWRQLTLVHTSPSGWIEVVELWPLSYVLGFSPYASSQAYTKCIHSCATDILGPHLPSLCSSCDRCSNSWCGQSCHAIMWVLNLKGVGLSLLLDHLLPLELFGLFSHVLLLWICDHLSFLLLLMVWLLFINQDQGHV